MMLMVLATTILSPFEEDLRICSKKGSTSSEDKVNELKGGMDTLSLGSEGGVLHEF